MGAALAELKKLGPLLTGKLGSGDTITALVRLARFAYIFTLSTIGLAAYTGWRNKRVSPGDKTKWPIPGLTKASPVYPPDRADPDISGYDTTSADLTVPTSLGTLPASGTVGPIGNKPTSLYSLALLAQRFGLRVSEYPPFGPVHNVHASGSLHYKGRAFDASSGDEKAMNNFAQFLKENYGRRLTELIHKPNASIKNGRSVPPSFWGTDTWNAHANHVHVGI